MAIIREKSINTRIERQIVIAMIMSKPFLEGIQTIYSPGSLRARFAQTIAQWCMEYFAAFGNAPGKEIQDIFITKKDTAIDPDIADAVEEFLTELSLEYEDSEEINVEYLLTKTEDHFRLSALEDHRIQITKHITAGRIEEAEQVVASFKRVARMGSIGIDPFYDPGIIQAALDPDSGDKLFKLYGDLGNVLGPLERGWLFAFVAASGVGKTWWLMLVALIALFSGLRVLFTSLEMSEIQMVRRLMQWATGLPIRQYNDGILVPVFDCELNQQGKCPDGCGIRLFTNAEAKDVENIKPPFDEPPHGYKPCTRCRGQEPHWKYKMATWGRIEQRDTITVESGLSIHHALNRSGIIKPNRLRLKQFPSGEVTMPELETYITNLESYEDFIPDVIITDYADKFRSVRATDYRHTLHDVWEAHKALSQKRNVLVVTASQSNTARSGKDIKDGDWAEDIRKKNLVDAGISINQSPGDKRQGVYRCSMMKQRHDDFNVQDEVFVLNSLKIGRPYIDSYHQH